MSIPAVAGFVGGWTLFHEVLPRVRGRITSESIRRAAYEVRVARGDMINGGGVEFGPAAASSPGQNRLAAAVVGQWQPRPDAADTPTMNVVYPAGYARAEVIRPAGAP
jgi:hypothetical protein